MTDLKPEDLVKLREIAEKATQGSWMRSGVRAKIDGRDCHSILAGPKEEIIASVWYNTKTHEGFSDAVFVSAFSPAVCLSLLADRARMEKALREAEYVLALVEQPRMVDPDHGDEVEALGSRIGFGALMSSAQASWRKHSIIPGGEFVAGPCFATVVATLKTIRQALGASQ